MSYGLKLDAGDLQENILGVRGDLFRNIAKLHSRAQKSRVVPKSPSEAARVLA